MSNTYTIQDIKSLLFEQGCTNEQLTEFRHDKRKGVQNLLVRYEKLLEKKAHLRRQFTEMSSFESMYKAQGKNYIAGIDEAGRGPLAGPVVAAAVILSDDFYLEGLNDSKQINKADRDHFFEYIKANALSYGISFVNSKEIDEVNIYEATKLSMHRAVSQLAPSPDQLLIDAVDLNDSTIPYKAIVKGDQKSISIAAASVLAKVSRDRYMEQIHQQYPHYHFNTNMGYGTKDHLATIDEYGISPYHRKSYAPVKQAINVK